MSTHTLPASHTAPTGCLSPVHVPGVLAACMQKLNRLFSDPRMAFWSAGTLLTSAVAMLMCAGGPVGAGGAAAWPTGPPAAPMLPGGCT